MGSERSRVCRGLIVIGLAVSVIWLASSAHAAPAEPRYTSGVGLMGAVSRGELRKAFGSGFGIEGFALMRLDSSGWLGLRLVGGMLDYGAETRRFEFAGPGPSIGVQLTTKRNATAVGLGPQLMWPRGRFRPYIYTLATVALFTSSADLSGRDSLGRAIVLSTDLNRSVWGAGAGMGATLRVQKRVSLDLGVEWRRYNSLRTLGRDAAKLSSGAVLVDEKGGDLSTLLIRGGVTVGARTGGTRGSP